MSRVIKKIFINKNFAFMWAGAIFVSFGFQMYNFSLPIIIYSLTESSLAMSIMKVANALPIIIIGILSASFIDKYNKKHIMLIVLIIEILLISITLLFTQYNSLSIYFLYLLGFLLSFCSYIFSIAKTSILPYIVKKEELLSANSKSTLTATLISIIGPSIAAVSITLLSFRFNFLVFLISLITLFFFINAITIDIESKNKNSKKKFKKMSIIELFSDKNNITHFTFTMVLLSFSNSLVNGVLTFFALNNLSVSPFQLGLAYSLSGIGGVLASLYISKLRLLLTHNKLILICVILNFIGIFMIVFTSEWWILGISIFIRTFGLSMLSIYFISYRQENVPIDMLGKVSSTFNMITKGVPILGTIIAGVFAEFFNIRLLFGFSSIIILYLMIKNIRYKPTLYDNG
ncbi:MFS transporter [Cytobacillus solani]|uniref:MFS transporter n=1 Tax=Cytobacillus solani TaxID=1637975 RepID=UPI00207A99C0|nr:MFS transporter [Cytobacillus solani]USK57372.1 MFS transporter [Cytobacillus solani]